MKISPPLCEPQVMRETYIKKLNEASNPTQKAKEIETAKVRSTGN